MPLKRGTDSQGEYYQWGDVNKKYYYKSESERKDAKQKAIRQAYAIEKSKERKGQKSELERSKETGKKTKLKGTNSSKR